jgi:hypothetical protein
VCASPLACLARAREQRQLTLPFVACFRSPQSSAAPSTLAPDAADAAPGEAAAIARRFELHETLQLCAVELPLQLTGVRTRARARTRPHAPAV